MVVQADVAKEMAITHVFRRWGSFGLVTGRLCVCEEKDIYSK